VRRSREAHPEELWRRLVQIKDQADAVAPAQWQCREDEPVWNAIRVDHIDWALAVNP
jgi:hypothetical protein